MLKKILIEAIVLALIGFWHEAKGQRKFMLFAGVDNLYTSNGISVRSVEPSLWLKKTNSILGLRLEVYDWPLVEKCNSFTMSYQYLVTRKYSPFFTNKLTIFAGLGVGSYVAKAKNVSLNIATIRRLYRASKYFCRKR